MKFCYNCGRPVEEGDKFCVECGAKLSLVNVAENSMQKEEQKQDAEKKNLLREEEIEKDRLRAEAEARKAEEEREKARLKAEEEARRAEEAREKARIAEAERTARLAEEEQMRRDAAAAREEKVKYTRNQAIKQFYESGEKESGERKGAKAGIIILVLVGIALGIIVGVCVGRSMSGNRKGYSSLEDAVQSDIDLLNNDDEASLFEGLSPEEWSVVYNHYADKLRKNSIDTVDKLKEEVNKRASDYEYPGGIRYDKPAGQSFAIEKNNKRLLPYYLRDMEYDVYGWNVEYMSGRGEQKKDLFLYYNKDAKWYSALGLYALDAVTDDISSSGKNGDVEAAEMIAVSVSAALANEDAYDEAKAYFDTGRLIAKAYAGRSFVSADNSPINHFLKELNGNLEGNATPELRSYENVNGWTPKGWAVKVSGHKPYVTVYITDYTADNMVELYPNVDENYR